MPLSDNLVRLTRKSLRLLDGTIFWSSNLSHLQHQIERAELVSYISTFWIWHKHSECQLAQRLTNFDKRGHSCMDAEHDLAVQDLSRHDPITIWNRLGPTT